MLAQLSKVEKQVVTKASQEKLYGCFKHNMTSIPQMLPKNFKSFEIVGGGTELKTGSVIRSKYCLDGHPQMAVKVKVEAVDDARKSISFDVLEGDILQLYKSFKAKIQIGADYIKWTLEYEKAKEDAPNPDAYLDVAAKVSKGFDAHLSK